MLSGQTVNLRAIDESDLLQLLAWRNDPKLRRYFREYRELNCSQQKKWFDHMVNGSSEIRMFAIVDKSENLLGACGLCYIDWVNRNADFSIYIGHQDLYIDALYTIDAAQLMISYAFDELGLHRLWAEIYDFDELKVGMFATLNFSLDGRHKETHWAEGVWHDSLFYSLLEP